MEGRARSRMAATGGDAAHHRERARTENALLPLEHREPGGEDRSERARGPGTEDGALCFCAQEARTASGGGTRRRDVR